MATPKKKRIDPSDGRKKPAPKTGKKARKAKKPARKPLNQGLLSLLILFSIVLVLGLLAHFYLESPKRPSVSERRIPAAKEVPLKRPGAEKPPGKITVSRPWEKRTEAVPGLAPPSGDIPVYEVPLTEDPVIKRKIVPVEPSGKPRVAIIIDDIGYDAVFADKLMNLGVPITLSILPGSPHSVEIAEKAHAMGFEVMLHQPMEPEEYPEVNPGPGAVLMRMGADESIAVLKKNLKSIPHVRGVNNHMGSRLTSSERHMNQVFTVLKQENLFFIDSLTSPKSLGKSSARLFKLPFAGRDVFLDHVQTKKFVEKQTGQLFNISKKYGSSIGIGHPYAVTLEVLQRRIPEERERVEFVFASELVKIIEE